MTNRKSGYKGKKNRETLFSRWKSDPYKIIIEKIIEKRFISKKTPLFEEKYDLRAVNLRKMALEKISLKGACLNQVCGYQVSLDHCDLGDVKIDQGDFEGAIIKNTNFANSILDKCVFRNAVFNHVVLENCIIRECNFEGAQLIQVNIEGSSLEDCDLTQVVNLSDALFIGKPKSIVNLKIDIDRLQESAFKTMIIESNL